MKPEKIVGNILDQYQFPPRRILFLHTRIKPLFQLLNGVWSYQELSDFIIEYLEARYQPLTIMFPVYTYAFTKTGIYHRIFSKSEVGRFAEEQRLKQIYYRTPNPVFSVLDTQGVLRNISHINHLTATGKNSLFTFLQKEDAIIVNLSLDVIRPMQLHYYEELFQVDYRFSKSFDGVIYHDEKNFEHVSFDYYVRKLDRPTEWNREKIKNDLLKADVWNLFEYEGLEFGWMNSSDLFEYVANRMNNNSKYLID
ncbi:MAG TPA: hypothetical protein PKC76_06010 [Saprospiraceae bacterium]|nr:hypothetical protein [Saprospiraceae bacterium]HMP23665.1 hypothetical protein [Saprospiraceae bacterium]